MKNKTGRVKEKVNLEPFYEKLEKLNTDYSIGDDLREYLEKPSDVKKYIELQSEILKHLETPKSKVKTLGHLGLFSRMLGDLDKAEQFLGEAMKIVDENDLEPSWWATTGLRLAHVYQWQKRFELALGMFEDILETCDLIESLNTYRHFALQHLGKMHFDMGDFESALECFEEVHALRMQSGNKELIQSTSRAIEIVNQRILEESEDLEKFM